MIRSPSLLQAIRRFSAFGRDDCGIIDQDVNVVHEPPDFSRSIADGSLRAQVKYYQLWLDTRRLLSDEPCNVF